MVAIAIAMTKLVWPPKSITVTATVTTVSAISAPQMVSSKRTGVTCASSA
jgi:hypothetical protein